MSKKTQIIINKQLILIFVFFCFFNGFSQNKKSDYKKPDFKKIVDSILVSKPKTYKDINLFLRPFRRDSTKLKELIKTFDSVKYLDGKTYAENLLGIRYRNYTRYKKAIQIHKQALETAKKAKSIEFQVFSLNMLGVDFRQKENLRTALDYNQAALTLAETVKNPSLGFRRSIAVSHNSMGNIYLLLKQYDFAIKQFEQSQIIEKSINNKLGLAINNQNIGYAKDGQGKIDEALEYFNKSLAINKESKNQYGQLICNNNIANIYIKQGKYNTALKLIEKSLPIAKKIGNNDLISSVYLNLGWAQAKLKKYTVAQKNILKGLSIAKKYNLKFTISEGYTYLYELNLETKNFKKALKYYKLAEEFDEKISNERNMQYVNDLILKYDSEQKNNQIKDLAKQNEITKLQLTKNKILWSISFGLFALLGIIFYYLYRNKLLKNEKKIITLEQDALRSQMNPHFIFNSLNSIKLYIIDNEKENAVYYLNKFSKLIRKILVATHEKEITLAEEIETMELYLNIENIRFNNEIETNIIIDKNLGLNTIKIPPLILQPFIENAIWHGLSLKKEKRKLQIFVEKYGNTHVSIIILDNGIGRKKSAEIKEKKRYRKNSIGIQLTKERLQNFCKDYKNSCSLNFVDLYNENKEPNGTKVILRIPIS